MSKWFTVHLDWEATIAGVDVFAFSVGIYQCNREARVKSNVISTEQLALWLL